MSTEVESNAMDTAASATTLEPTPSSSVPLTKRDKHPITVTKPVPYTFDLGNLLINDFNPLPSTTESSLLNTARDAAQALINQLLTTCTITSTSAGVHLTLPEPSTPLPREKPVPSAAPKTAWEKFAAKKGIRAKKREGKTVFDEASGEWVPKWGYKGANKKGEEEWIVEVDEKTQAKADERGGSVRGLGRAERKERVRRNERKMRANKRGERKAGG
ncbi:MAG: Rhodanese- sulfurtransferase [Trizodia sp. TS-e1964]|nr:MAG: Rhodanese- sulfurtransferase [Trizodia sp. TS-e1964]